MEPNADPKIWGPHVWATMHAFALYVDRTQDLDRLIAFRAFLNDLVALLPCTTCRQDYSAYLAKHEMPGLSRAFEWTVDLHNYVNRKTGRPAYSLEAAKAQWTTSTCTYACSGPAPKTEQPFVFGPAFMSNSIAVLCLTVLVGAAVWYSLQGSRKAHGPVQGHTVRGASV